ncbi:ABC transporter substrate-binding protein [Microbacterium sp. Marseille-Q6965]|uniref:ABC transporter substrate-binding protein n=1 Tax=Microbacterium sp. Marseille-Q6965 TaxID=2965072 RepID=UPI0021B74699|nr:extracellular solute-binding protein [Microbacterium sp. Marseille-Q6965]
MSRPRIAVSLAALAAISMLAGCGAGGSGQGDGASAESLTFWTPQTTPERLAVQESVAAAFEDETGIAVEVVPMAGADADQAIATGAASGDVPDVVLLASPQVSAWNAQGLIDTAAAAAAVESLGAETFNEHALEAVTLDGTVSAVPSDGWTHLVAYRADLLEQAGVEAPTSVAELAAAATTIKEQLGITGLAFGTQPGTASATEGVQSIFQSAGCELVEDGTVTIDSPACVEAAEHFLTLRNSSTQGDMDVPAAQAAYLAGDAAMLLFSTHILDELNGLAEATPVTCGECAGDPQFLAKNSKFLTVIDEDNPRQYGAILSYVVPTGAQSEAAQQFIEYAMSSGYIESLSAAAEGRIPLRNGTAESPTEYIDAWGDLGIGVDGAATTAEVYGEEFVAEMGEGINSVYLWGMGTGDTTLAGLVSSQGVLAAQIEQLYNGASAEEVTAAMKQAVEEVQAGL